MVGVLDLASNVSEGRLFLYFPNKSTYRAPGSGIRNTTTVFDAPKCDRVRVPRHVPYDGILQVCHAKMFPVSIKPKRCILALLST